MHSEDDQIVPYVAAGPLSAKLLKHGTLKTYKGFPHGMPTTHAEMINADLSLSSRAEGRGQLIRSISAIAAAGLRSLWPLMT